MRALSLRQPWAELVVRGEKTIEVRGRHTHIRGPVQVYAGLKRIDPKEEVRIGERYGLDVDALPRGVLVGTVNIVDSRPLKKSDSPRAAFKIEETEGQNGWILADPHRFKHPVKTDRQPQPSFFESGVERKL